MVSQNLLRSFETVYWSCFLWICFLNKHNLTKIEILIGNLVGKSSCPTKDPRNFSGCVDYSKMECDIKLAVWGQTSHQTKCLEQKLIFQNKFLSKKYDAFYKGRLSLCNLVSSKLPTNRTIFSQFYRSDRLLAHFQAETYGCQSWTGGGEMDLNFCSRHQRDRVQRTWTK